MQSKNSKAEGVLHLLDRFPALRRLARDAALGRIPLVRQLSATDCGAAAIAMVLAYHGKEVPLAEIRQTLGIGRNGTTASALLSAGRLYGLRGRSVRVEVDDLSALQPGSILYWEFRHYVVLERVEAELSVFRWELCRGTQSETLGRCRARNYRAAGTRFPQPYQL